MKLQILRANNFTKSLMAVLLIGSMWSCGPDEEVPIVEPAPAALDESKFASLVVSDAISNDLVMVHLRDGKIEKMPVANPKSYVYSTNRFVYSIQRDQNQLQFFDTGLAPNSTDKPVLMSRKMEMKQPTHFYASGDYGVIFNDGDGTVGLVNVSNLAKGNESDSKVINFGGAIHHGAAAKFDNGTIAVTDKEPNMPGALPQKVVVIDQTGKRVHTNTVTVTGIHGEAGNGKVALFGSTNGVVAVNQDGSARLISYPAPLTNTSGNWLGTLAGNKNTPSFYGFAGKLGVFKVDAVKNEVSPVFEAANVGGIQVTDDGSKLVVLLTDGSIKIFNTTTNKELATFKGDFTPPTGGTTEGSIRPVIRVTNKHALRSNPNTGEVEAFDLNTLTSKFKFNVGGKPFSMTLAGTL